MTGKPKVLYFVERYAQISETYIENEVKALIDRYDLRVLSFILPDLVLHDHLLPFTITRNFNQARDIGRDFAPDVIHGHYLTIIERIAQLSEALQAPFTLRAHSFDILGTPPKRLAAWSRFANAENCLGILTFPFTIPWLKKAGFKESKLVPCWPVVDVAAFANQDENGKGVMNTGAALPKKNMEDFILLGSKVPERKFTLYPLGYNLNRLLRYNNELKRPVTIAKPVQPKNMPAQYKKQEWLVYTANPEMKTVGWPLSVAEAQASGVGVCLANIRPDLKDYVGDCGFLYDDLDHAAKIISQPFPQELRERGFELAWRNDIRRHIHRLEDLWPKRA
jgi:glycosyltransferase involved in cell wall biosynthesis